MASSTAWRIATTTCGTGTARRAAASASPLIVATSAPIVTVGPVVVTAVPSTVGVPATVSASVAVAVVVDPVEAVLSEADRVSHAVSVRAVDEPVAVIVDAVARDFCRSRIYSRILVVAVDILLVRVVVLVRGTTRSQRQKA